MARKRPSRRGDLEDNSRKRLKIVHEVPTSEEIHSLRQLRQLLTFDQDLKSARHGLQSFKVLLDSVLSEDADKKDEREERRKLVLEYLESTRPRAGDGEEEPVYLPDIVEVWSMAGKVNNEHILSAVPVVLDLVLKLLSQALELVPLGLGICRTLVQKRPLELIAWNLSAEKNKEFIISPTLRLLREALCFDGGAIAKPMFRARMSTFKSLARNMGVKYIGDGTEETKRPSARTNAVRFYLGALKYLHPEAKRELLSQRDIVGALTRTIREDPPYLIVEILKSLKQHVLLDDKVPRDAKGKLLNSNTLSKIASLYTYEHPQVEGSNLPSIEELIHDFLMLACTSPSAGVLRKDYGFYPKDIDQEDASVVGDDTLDGLGLENISWMNKFKDEVPVKNVVLAEFLQTLRPWSSIKQSDLVIAIFNAVPELVAHYFIGKKTFTFEPKLTATWIGYAAFIFNVVALPIPPYFGQASGYSRLPPPPSLVIDNILPLPLNQKAMSRCLMHKSNLISFFATRILVMAIEKLQKAVEFHQDPSHSNISIWTEAGRKLVDDFCQRSPGIQDVINSFRSIPEDDILHGEAASRLLRRYYEVIPQVALTAKFDVSPFLDAAVSKLAEREGSDPKDHALSLRRLENLLAIARYSPGMRWFSKSEALQVSPFTALLRVYITAPLGVALDGLLEVLNAIAKDEQVVPVAQEHPGLLPLLESLRRLKESGQANHAEIWTFLDDCLSRFVAAPIKYLETVYELAAKLEPSEEGQPRAISLSPIVIVMLKQLKFSTEHGLLALAQFLPVYVGLSLLVGEHRDLLESIFLEMTSTFSGDKKPAAKSISRMKLPTKLKFRYYAFPSKSEPRARNKRVTRQPQEDQLSLNDEELVEILAVPDALSPDNSTLSKWVSKTVDELMDDGYVGALISLLTSEHISIRKEALTNILKLAAKIRQSEYDEKDQIWLLLSELAETAKPVVDAGPLPSPTAAFGRHAFEVLKNPLHPVYEKVNVFLTRGPVWNIDRIPLVHEILLEEPSVDDTYYATVNWLLTYLIDGLRTPADLALFHKKRTLGPIFERVLALAGNPYLRTPLRMQILKAVYRGTCIDGGSTMLTTRFGIVAWLEARRAASKEKEESSVYRALMGRIWRTCDQARVEAWSRGGVGELCA
ncbi:hypothetical protein GQ53DRAFT_703627 [Thozetella sp. PMI_491]|nr:hypothetical protein GQ53DRAFT_703627 [Thozetella sp. PMI_491]